MSSKVRSLFGSPEIVREALVASLVKLDPRLQVKNPVMFVVFIGSLLTTLLFVQALRTTSGDTPWFVGGVALWLWFTVLFANFAEAIAEGHGKAQADTLRKSRQQVNANKIYDRSKMLTAQTPAPNLRPGDEVIVRVSELIPADGEVIEGVASVDESAITGESAPVVRESGGDRSSVTGGTRVVSDFLIIRVTTMPGESFLDRMIAMVEGAKRQKTPNEIALAILLAGFTIIFLLVVATLLPFSLYSVEVAKQAKLSQAQAESATFEGEPGGVVAPSTKKEPEPQPITITTLVALLVCLIPTTIGALLSAIGIAGMNRLSQANVIAMSGRAVEAAGDIDVLLLDKTGTITLGNRQATAFIPAEGVTPAELADAAQLSSLADETPEGRSIVVLAKRDFGLRGRELDKLQATFIPFSASTRMSGIDMAGKEIRKGSADAVDKYIQQNGGQFPPALRIQVESISRSGGTPLVVAERSRALGVIQLKDIVKGGIKERFAELRQMGIKTVMITGDNPLTAASIAAESGVDDFLAEATPEAKLKLIREYQQGGRLVAMTGDGTNDAPALAQADVAVAMNSGTQAAKEAGNMVDLDSNPTKLIEIVNIGKQLLMTRGALTTFSIANDVAKYFAIIPAAFASTYPALKSLDIMRLHSPNSAILSAVIFNALVIIALIPLALKGVKYRPVGAALILRDNLLIYGLGGLIVPFVFIKLIDLLLVLCHLA
jgi:K+-transporting ATPase ATPase B chain